jgi:oligopeptidase A
VQNPLLKYKGLPPFDKIQAEHVEPAIKELLTSANTALSDIEQVKDPTWDNVLEPLEEISLIFDKTVGPVMHLLAVKNSDALRAAHDKVLPDIVQFRLKTLQSKPVYEHLRSIQKKFATKLQPVQQRILKKYIEERELSGIALTGEKQQRYNDIEKRLSELGQKFSNNVLDDTKKFALTLTAADEIVGLPTFALEQAAADYNRHKKPEEPQATATSGPWRIGLDMTAYIPFMKFSERRDLRERLYSESVIIASKGEHDNTDIIKEMLNLRKEKSQLLGFDTYAALSTSQKMAMSVDRVEKLLGDLLTASHSTGKKEHEELEAFAKGKGLQDHVCEWDLAYYSERLKEEKFKFTEDELLPYFPMPKVLDGLFALLKRLFAIDIKPADGKAPIWHPDVRYFEIFNDSGKNIAAFYLDPFSRPAEKRGGAWMGECIIRRKTSTGLENPVAYLVCNGTPPVSGKPALMSFSQVRTLFHEFGHGLQHMLTTSDYSQVAGIREIEWDAVELPSQFMENWLFHKPTLLSLTSHVDTGATLPEHYVEKLIASRNYRSAYAMLRQLSFAMVDMELHHRFDPQGKETVFDVDRRIREKIRVSAHPPRKENKFLCGFSHIFPGGYSAGYYSYKWAEVLSADAFSAFEEAGLENTQKLSETGRRFKDTVLSLGGGEHPMEVFKAFRGREPKPDALLRHSGLA